jgi:hypothetical protein
MEGLLRAKVARVESELRLLGDALEHYRTDYPEYPKSIFADLGTVQIELGIFATLPKLTTPIPYLKSLPQDPFIHSNYQYFSTLIETNSDRIKPFQETYGSWVVLSVGPDKDLNLNGINGRIIHYSPTNGSLSNGDIVRSQKESRYEPD